MATASLVTGLLFFVPLLPVVAAGLGVAAIIRISRSGGRLSGRGRAIAGMALGAIFIAAQFAAVLAVPGLLAARWQAREAAMMRESRRHLNMIGAAMSMYAGENDRLLPPDFQTLYNQPYHPDPYSFEHPLAERGVDLSNVDATSGYFYASPAAPLEAGDRLPVAWEKRAWPGRRVNVLMAGWEVETMTLPELDELVRGAAHVYRKPPKLPEPAE